MAARIPESGAAVRRPLIHASPERRPLIVWRFTDGKPGHDSQTRGLLAALRARVPVDDVTVHIADCRAGLVACLTGRTASALDGPDPDLIIGAGHATHLPMLNARRVRGGRVVVLMKPTLPTAWFDLCVIPAHDRTRDSENILVTRGVLNRVRHEETKDEHAGLILVGGPSAHVAWSTETVLAQIDAVLARTTDVHWTLTTSRRTPADFLARLDMDRPQLTVVPCEQTGP
ncbi:MAG: ELM1/GtrOC1 family putative glycosyltransferase, partial [Gammaproteobacteria bacterium]